MEEFLNWINGCLNFFWEIPDNKIEISGMIINVFILFVIAGISYLAHSLQKKKRNDDLFLIRYNWFDQAVEYQQEVRNFQEHLNISVYLDPSDPQQEDILLFKAREFNKKIQRHITKGMLIFLFPNFGILFKDFNEISELLYPNEGDPKINEWANKIHYVFGIEKLILALGQEIRIK